MAWLGILRTTCELRRSIQAAKSIYFIHATTVFEVRFQRAAAEQQKRARGPCEVEYGYGKMVEVEVENNETPYMYKP